MSCVDFRFQECHSKLGMFRAWHMPLLACCPCLRPWPLQSSSSPDFITPVIPTSSIGMMRYTYVHTCLCTRACLSGCTVIDLTPCSFQNSKGDGAWCCSGFVGAYCCRQELLKLARLAKVVLSTKGMLHCTPTCVCIWVASCCLSPVRDASQ